MPFKILYTADLHGNEQFYEKLFDKSKDTDIKAVVIGGDLCPRGGNTLQEWIELQKNFLENFLIKRIETLKKDFFLMMGNDDLRINFRILESSNIENLKLIHKKLHRIGSKNIVGYSFVNPTPFRLVDWEKPENGNNEKPKKFSGEIIRTIEEEKGTIKEDLQQLKKLSNPKSTIYVMHAPPFDTKLDITNSETHVGSREIRNFIEKEQPPLTLHGHIHESPKMSGSYVDKIGKTICINVGSSYPENKLNCVLIDIINLDIKYMELG